MKDETKLEMASVSSSARGEHTRSTLKESDLTKVTQVNGNFTSPHRKNNEQLLKNKNQ